MDKAHPGQKRIPAKDWNEIRDFINRYAQQPGGMINNPLNPFFVYVQNNTSSDLSAFSVVKLDGTFYPNRSNSDTVNAALNQLLEISAVNPTGEAGETIGILQEAIKQGEIGKAIVSGASLCYLQVESSNVSYQYAKSVEGRNRLNAETSVGQAKIIWKQSGYGRSKLAYVLLNDTDDRERFLIKASSNPTPSDYVKGNLEYIVWSESDKAWIPGDYDDDSSRLVVCQENMPSTLSVDFWMPYYPLEDNIGVEANRTTGTGESFVERCGVYPGEHVLSNKRLDYHYANGRYTYEPRFIYIGDAKGSGSSGVSIEIEGKDYDVTFPTVRSTTSFPDVYAYDQITVEVDARGNEPEINAVDYPMDFPEDTIISSYSNLTSSPYRGWEDITNTKYNYDIGYSDLLVLKKRSGGTQIADLRTHQCTCNSGGSSGSGGSSSDSGGGHTCPHDEVTTAEASFRWYKKIKTDALI